MLFNSLRNQIILVFFSLFLGLQLLGLFPIQLSINKNAAELAQDDLKTGKAVFLNILENNAQNLTQGSQILAADFGFKSSVATNEAETILSALNNQKERIHADVAIFYSNQNNDVYISGPFSKADVDPIISRLITNNGFDKAEFEILHNKAYQLVAVPVKAPIVIGWVLIGFKIDDVLANKLKQLSNLEVTFIQQDNNVKFNTIASTLPPSQASALVKAIDFSNQFSNDYLKVEINDEQFDLSLITLHQGNKSLTAILQRSLDETATKYQDLKNTIYLLIGLGLLPLLLGTVLVSRQITAPIKSLERTAKSLSAGNFDVVIHSERKDEIGQFTRAFEAMRMAIFEREKKVYSLAYIDQVTLLPNRVALREKILQLTTASFSSNFTILLLSVNRFRQMNKILGNAQSEELLKKISTRLKSFWGDNTFIAKGNDDQFYIVFLDAYTIQAELKAVELTKLFNQPFNLNERSIDITISQGLATYPEHGLNVELLVHHCESALAHAQNKKLDYAFYDASLSEDEQIGLISELKHAITNNELVLYLQPKVNLITNQVYGAEALIRWIHPQKGFIFPDKFIPLAEQSGLIRDITYWVLEAACKTLVSLYDQGHEISIAVNISTQDLMDNSFPSKLSDLIAHHGIRKNSISLEVTESGIMDDSKLAISTLTLLRKMGFEIAIDDFGTGHSSLSYLKLLPVQELKIDKSFVLKLDQNDSDQKIVRSTVDLAHHFNLKVVAEGIENQSTWTLLAKFGCDFGQGYHIAKPMPAKDFSMWLTQWHQLHFETHIS